MKEKNKPKCKEWERRRREKLNEAFNILAQLLPNYDPAKNIAKIDVLERSTDFVKELRLSNSRLVCHQVESDEKCKLIKELQDEVNKLILRVKQLTILLKTANIPIPSGPSITSLGKRKMKWSGKIHDKSSNNSLEKVSDEENSRVTEGNEEDMNPTEDAGAKKGTEDANTNNSSSTSNSTPLKEMNGSVVQIPGPPIVRESPKSGVSTDKPKPSTSRLKRKSQPSSTTKPKVIPKSPIKPPAHNKLPEIQTSTSTSTSSFQPLLQNGTMIPLLNSAPITAVFTEPPTSTTATILPMQTIFLTSTPSMTINNQSCSSSPVITRIALGPSHHQLFSHGLSGTMGSGILQKIPIQSIRKPIPKIKWKRKRRNKAVAPVGDGITTKEVTQDISASPSTTKDIDNVAKTDDSQPKESAITEKIDDSLSEPTKCGTCQVGESGESEVASAQVEEIMPQTDETEVVPPGNDKKLSKTLPKTLESPPSPSLITEQSKNSPELMQIQLFAHEPDPEQEVMEVEPSSSSLDAAPSPSSSRVLCELQSRNPTNIEVPMRHKDSINTPEKSVQKSTIEQLPEIGNVSKLPKSTEISSPCKAGVLPKSTTATDISISTSSRCSQEEVASSLVQENMNIDPIPTFHQEPSSSNSETVSGDKISECIARSMDLIDAPDGELMELGDNWATSSSPKSPISPTQMFLSMFPLLPKENVVSISTSETNQMACSGLAFASMSTPRLFPTSGYTSHTHRSFFIDSMLPEDSNSVGTVTTGLGRNQNQQPMASTQFKNFGVEQGKSSRSLPETATTTLVSTIPTKVTETNTNIAPIVPIVTASSSRSSDTVTKSAKIGTKSATSTTTAAAATVSTPNKSVEAKDTQRPHTYSGGQGIFKDLHLFSSDSVDFSTFPSLPFTQMTDQMDIFRGESSSSRSRVGLFDPILSLTLDQAGCVQQPIATPSTDHFHMQHLDISENIHQNLQFHFNRDRVGSTENFSSGGESSFSNTRGSKTSCFSHTPQPNINSLPTVTSSSGGNIVESVANFGSSSYSSAPYYSNTATNPPPKITIPTKPSTAIAHSHQSQPVVSRQLFRPQGHDLTETVTTSRQQYPSTFGHSAKTISNAKRPPNKGHEARTVAQLKPSVPSKEGEKSVQGNVREAMHPSQSLINDDQFSLHKSQASSSTKPSSADKRRSSAASAKKSRIESKPEHIKGAKELKSKEIAISKKSVPAKQNIPSCPPTQDFHQFPTNSLHQSVNPPSITSTTAAIASSATDIFQPHFFGHSANQQAFDHSHMNLNIFPEFSHPADCNPHYDHYSMDFNFSSNANQTQQQFLQPTPITDSTDSNMVPETQTAHHTPAPPHHQHYHHSHPQSQTNPRASRPTPFYLQDVNCDNFSNNFEAPLSHNAPSAQSHHQTMHSSSSSTRTTNQSSNVNSHPQNQQYGHNTSNFGSNPPSHQATEINSTPSVGHRHQPYFQSPVPVANSQSQHSQPVSVSSAYANPIVSRQTSSTQQLNQTQTNPTSSSGQPPNSRNVQIQQHQLHSTYANPQSQPQTIKMKPASNSSAPSVSQQNQYSGNSSTLLGPPPPSNATSSSSSSHRPSQHSVNWMTDNQTLSNPIPTSALNNAFSTRINANNPSPTTTSIITNPFSVSKLVGLGTTSGNVHSNTSKGQTHPHSRQSSNSASNYCAENLIRKNPTAIGWPPSSASSSNSKSQQQPQSVFHSSSQLSISSPITNHTHNFNVNSSHQPQPHLNSYNNHSHEQSFPGTGYNFHGTPSISVSQSHPQNYQPFDQSHSSGNNHGHQLHQQQLQFQPNPNQTNNPHHIHHLHNIGTTDSQQGGTSSVSNFNLSTIFPEINDKRQQQQQQQRNAPSSGPGSVPGSSNSNNRNNVGNNNNQMANVGGAAAAGLQNRASSGNCGYYAQQPSHGQSRNK